MKRFFAWSLFVLVGMSALASCKKTDADCPKGLCATNGDCGMGADGTCGPTKPEHCTSSKFCAESGMCSLVKLKSSWCSVQTDADCKRSTECTKNGKCIAVAMNADKKPVGRCKPDALVCECRAKL